MSSQSFRRGMRRALTGDIDVTAPRRWASHGFAALAISALGLGIAGAAAGTTNAEPPRPVAPRTLVAAPATRPVAPTPTPVDPTPSLSASQQAALRAFRAQAASRSEPVRKAIVRERAAQRAEELTKAAEEVARAGRKQTAAARQAELAATDRSIREAGVKIAAERRRRALVARLTAKYERELAEKEAAAAAAAAARRAAEPAAPAQVNATPRRAEPQQSSEPRRSSSVSSGGGDGNSGGGNSGGGNSGGGWGGAASPVPGAVIGAHFGQYGLWSRYHTGLDFRAGYGTPIRAVKSGTVLFAGNSGDWAGNHVAIKHGDGMTTMSSHMSSMSVSAGQNVGAGQVIGYVGQTGRAFGAHLHFELYPAGVRFGDVYRAINPQPWLSANGVQTR